MLSCVLVCLSVCQSMFENHSKSNKHIFLKIFIWVKPNWKKVLVIFWNRIPNFQRSHFQYLFNVTLTFCMTIFLCRAWQRWNKLSVPVNQLCVSWLCVLSFRVEVTRWSTKVVPCKWYSEGKQQGNCLGVEG